ncbi:MAG TPA: glycosyltransferase family 87 protein [Candidatus Binatia bacterium]|nr:glycosyltransferase family 87 protein [Candidatus Binatia bacterium]
MNDRFAARLRGVERFVDRSTQRRAGVLRRALRREVSRLRDPRRRAAVIILAFVFGLGVAGLVARGEAAGADARAYWAAVRIWLGGGDPYHPTGPFLPYVYPPWMLPFFAPWALMPWDVAWFVWRVGSFLLLFWTIDWAYRRRPLETAVVVALLAFPLAANLDTGNVNLHLALMLWAAQFSGPRLAGALWAVATWMKWVPAPFIVVLAPRARAWGLLWLAVAASLSLLTLPLTIVQLQALFGFGPRPLRLDYLVLLWAAVPWLWRHPNPLWWVRSDGRRRLRAEVAAQLAAVLAAARRGDEPLGLRLGRAGRALLDRARAFLGLAGGPAD